jgi:hypothetical protein
MRTSSIEPATRGDSGQVIWIDTRFGRTDRSPLNPLGGVPWSDSPDWPNNDVFALPLRAILHAGTGAEKLTPVRLTNDLSLTRCVRAHATADAVYVVWAGWTKIDRAGSYRAAPMSIHYARLPLD